MKYKFILKYYCLLSFVIFLQITNGQNAPGNSQNLIIENRFHSGKIVKNYPSFPERSLSWIYEFNLSKQTTGENSWHVNYGYPRIGLSVFCGSLGNTDILGNVTGLVPNMNLHLIKGKNWQTRMTLGCGFAYFQKPYDSVNNAENILIGSKITNYSFATLSFNRKINQRLVFTSGISAMHCSNGHYQVPNLGMNIIAVSMGLKYFPRKIPVFEPEPKSMKPENDLKLNFRTSLGVHEFARTLGPVGGPKYSVYCGSVFLSKRFGWISNVHAGFTGKYYTNFYEFITENNFYEDKHHLKSTVITFFLAHEFMIDRFSLLTQGGIDLHNPFFKDYDKLENIKMTTFRFLETYISTRLGFQYYLLPINNRFNIYTGIYIKANFGQADFIAANIGFSI